MRFRWGIALIGLFFFYAFLSLGGCTREEDGRTAPDAVSDEQPQASSQSASPPVPPPTPNPAPGEATAAARQQPPSPRRPSSEHATSDDVTTSPAQSDVPDIADASPVIVYPDGRLRRIYPEDFRIGALVTTEEASPAVQRAEAFLSTLMRSEIPNDMILEASRFMLAESLGAENLSSLTGYRLGVPEQTGPESVSIPAVLLSGRSRALTTIHMEYEDDVWYIAEFPVFPGMFDRDGGASQPKQLFDPRAPQL